MPAEDGSNDSGDPDSRKNIVYILITEAINHSNGRLRASSFGIVDKTLKNWRGYGWDWLPSAATLEEILLSTGFKHLELSAQSVIICAWLTRSALSASRSSPASYNFVRAIDLITAAAPESIWEGFPQKLAA